MSAEDQDQDKVPERPMERLLLRPNEACEVLGIGKTKLYELMAAGELPVVRIGRSPRFPVKALRKWVDDQIRKEDHGEAID